MSKPINIAIDGPSGAGKSTLARRLAAELNFVYVDTGAMFRTIALYCSRKGVDRSDKDAVVALLRSIHLDMRYGADGEQQMLLNGENVSGLIRTPEISMYTSAISAYPEVRSFLLEQQRELGRTKSILMDGRDIGTVVLPDAELKIFLSASPECRARRRYDELIEKGMDVKYEDILSDVIARDYADSHRDIAPLKPADDAIMVDTSGEDLETSVNKLLTIMRDRI
jgi:cytidylate kinase